MVVRIVYKMGQFDISNSRFVLSELKFGELWCEIGRRGMGHSGKWGLWGLLGIWVLWWEMGINGDVGIVVGNVVDLRGWME